MKCHHTHIFVIWLFTTLLPYVVKSEFFTAIVDMKKLLRTEEEIARALEKYVKIEEKRLENVKLLSKKFAELNKSINEDAEKFLSNPISAYLLVKSLTTDWKKIKRLSRDSNSRAVIRNITSKVLTFPNNEDLFGAASALIRLQDVYLLDAATIAQGQIKGTEMSIELTADDCFGLGRQTYHGQAFNYSLLWMQESMIRADMEGIQFAEKGEILEYMAAANYALENYTAAAELTEYLISLEPYNPRAWQNLEIYRFYEAEKEANGTQEKEPEEWPEDILDLATIHAYKRLCRGESLKTPKEESKLRCYYTTNSNSYLLLQPVKMEVLNLEPRVAVYHDVLNDREADVLTSLAMPKLARATINVPKTGDLEVANVRISKSAWLDDDEHDLIPRINQRIEDITGIDTEHSENLHCVNYGIGGYYEPHFDFVKAGDKVSFMKDMGNRIATWLFYLTTVPAGGSTVFPSIGVEVKPIKGSAVFWYNLNRNGTGDMNTRHAACPVLAGSKWISNKWLHEIGNEFNRPCSLNKLE